MIEHKARVSGPFLSRAFLCQLPFSLVFGTVFAYMCRTNMDAILKTEQLRVEYPVRQPGSRVKVALQGLDLSVRPGEVFGFQIGRAHV